MHSLPGFIIFFHEVSFFLPTNIGKLAHIQMALEKIMQSV